MCLSVCRSYFCSGETAANIEIQLSRSFRVCHETRLCAYVQVCVFMFCASVNSLTIKKADDKIFVCGFSKNVKSKLYHKENSKIRGQTV